MRRSSLIGAGVALAVAGATLLWLHRGHESTPAAGAREHSAPRLPARAHDEVAAGGSNHAADTGATPAPDAPPREVAMQLERDLTAQMERALVSGDAAVREAAFAFTLPELLRRAPSGVIALIARQPAGEARDALRDETARLWIRADRDAAVEWLRSLPDAERAAAGMTAVRSLAAVSPPQAVRVADELQLGRDDGSVDHILQLWAAAEPYAARRWQAEQPR